MPSSKRQTLRPRPSFFFIFLFFVGALFIRNLGIRHAVVRAPAKAKLQQNLSESVHPFENTQHGLGFVSDKYTLAQTDNNELAGPGKQRRIKLNGYWKEVRASLGLVSLPDTIPGPVVVISDLDKAKDVRITVDETRDNQHRLWRLGRINTAVRRSISGTAVEAIGSSLLEVHNQKQKQKHNQGHDSELPVSSQPKNKHIKEKEESPDVIPGSRTQHNPSLLSSPSLKLEAEVEVNVHSTPDDLLGYKAQNRQSTNTKTNKKLDKSHPSLFLSDDSKPGSNTGAHTPIPSLAAAFRAIAAHELDTKSHRHADSHRVHRRTHARRGSHLLGSAALSNLGDD